MQLETCSACGISVRQRGRQQPSGRTRCVAERLTTKADKIRALFRAGYSRSEIAEHLGIRYQHVRNVLVQSGFMETQLSRPCQLRQVETEVRCRSWCERRLGRAVGW